ncbi:hypothetical protein DERP_005523 [Dermatophagoides pteronyssinus]|uniref:Uncharacterized protein n=1 Tax=Dermatophagoides pteronyssinus TaxID=6956 RepID=A0ABQ8JMU7_DERPT|nr:hypothetical protein DERP_005523 [Dermatophagoides pteronyssinus]
MSILTLKSLHQSIFLFVKYYPIVVQHNPVIVDLVLLRLSGDIINNPIEIAPADCPCNLKFDHKVPSFYHNHPIDY